jgi:hypothetical protein
LLPPWPTPLAGRGQLPARPAPPPERLFFFAIWLFLLKILTSVPLSERFQKMYPELGVLDLGAEVKHIGAMDYGAEVDDMVNDVTSKILHLPPRRRRSCTACSQLSLV